MGVFDAEGHGKFFFYWLWAIFTVVAGLAVTVHLFAQQDAPPQEHGAAPSQPIPFSHKTHVTAGLQCAFCHQTIDPGINISIPPSSKCMQCHASVAKDRPAIQALAQYNQSGKPVPWNRVYTVPAFVFWNHRTHLQIGLKCEECHGDVSHMDVMRVVTEVTMMKGCVDCHEQRSAPTGCSTCHEDMGNQ